MSERLFTLDEALATLPAAARLLLDIQEWKQELEDRSAHLEQLLNSTEGNQLIITRYIEYATTASKIGVIKRDIFPPMRLKINKTANTLRDTLNIAISRDF